ncbi:MAG TPA: enoyl-[acyl-carrier-protein] reductase, partial [Gemmatimonadales bacterium]
MLAIDLSGKRALVAGVSDDGGFGFAIAKALAEAGSSICLGSWPPALGIFTKLLERGKMDESMQLAGGGKLQFERIYPLDAAYDTLDQAPAEIRENKRYKEVGDFSVQGMTDRIRSDFGERPLDIVVHSLANAPEVKSPLVDTSRSGYLSAISVSAYSNISLVRHLAPLMREGGSFLSLSYMAGERVIPGYGGGMSSAKAALEADTRTLAYEAGRRWGVRINAISAGPWASRAASAIGFIDTMIRYTASNSPLPRPIDASEVGSTAAFLSSPLARAITGSVVY